MFFSVLIALATGWPALAALVITVLYLGGPKPNERVVARIATSALVLSLGSVLVAAFRWLVSGPVDVRLGYWFHAGTYGFELVFLCDGTSIPIAVLAGILLLATCRFSANYLHREPGFARFFLLTLIFAAGMQLLVLSGSLELLFAGWELVGITSVLLVAFFHERQGPVRAAIRVLVTYRLCDIGLVLAVVFLHRAAHTTAFLDSMLTASGPMAVTTPIALGLLLAAMGKSAQFPAGGWLPRAMEGPTASSAVFYGGLSVHAGVYLLIRMAPMFEHAPWARAVVVIVGLITAVMATLSGHVSPDAKTSLAYATAAQVGLMFVECGFGLRYVALFHLSAHAILRYYQFLRTPSVLQDALARRAAVGVTVADEATARWELASIQVRRFVYRLALERFEVEATLERWIGRPILALSSKLDAYERKFMGSRQGR